MRTVNELMAALSALNTDGLSLELRTHNSDTTGMIVIPDMPSVHVVYHNPEWASSITAGIHSAEDFAPLLYQRISRAHAAYTALINECAEYRSQNEITAVIRGNSLMLTHLGYCAALTVGHTETGTYWLCDDTPETNPIKVLDWFSSKSRANFNQTIAGKQHVTLPDTEAVRTAVRHMLYSNTGKGIRVYGDPRVLVAIQQHIQEQQSALQSVWEVLTQTIEDHVFYDIRVRGTDPDAYPYMPLLDGDIVGDQTAEYNAQLMAAAPQLYSALCTLYDSYKALADSGDCGIWSLEETPEGQQALAALKLITARSK